MATTSALSTCRLLVEHAWRYAFEDVFDGDEDLFFVGSGLIIVGVFYWGFFGLLHLFCYNPSFNLFSKYKIQPYKSPPQDLLMDAIKQMFVEHWIAGPLLNWVLFLCLFKGRVQFGTQEIPSLSTFVYYVVLWHVMFDTWFYWSHRLMHVPYLYKRFHKQHHKFHVPVGICAGYANIVEGLFVNVMSTLIGPIVFPSHAAVLFVYYALRLHETVDAHSGYDFPWSPWRWMVLLHGGSRRHDWHHSNNMGNYGAFTYWDWICGTDVEYKKWLSGKQRRKRISGGKQTDGKRSIKHD